MSEVLTYYLFYLYLSCQLIYSFCFLMDLYFFTRPINWVDMTEVDKLGEEDYPYIILFYPVLKELEETMRTTFLSITKVTYPKDRYRVISIPNANDLETVASLRRLEKEFDFLEILEVPPTTDPSWQVVWDNWDANEKAYWWHIGIRAKNRNLPPKKTRQLIYAFYTTSKKFEGKEDFLVNYIDADSCPPTDHFLAAAVGIRHYDVLQATNIAGNLLDTFAASLHAYDHMAWDGRKYPHLSANGKHPYWVLGKALYFKGSDLLALGGFHPWITIEDPEVGMRFWANGRKIGIIENPVIEEVPSTFMRGIIQRKRWVCGFFQSLGEPLTILGMSRYHKFLAWLNFLPCLLQPVNVIGLPLGVWALWVWYYETSPIPLWAMGLSLANVIFQVVTLISFYRKTWKRSALVLPNRAARLWYLFRINPLVLFFWWLFWTIPLVIGYRMYCGEGGLEWIRTQKTDANADLIRKAATGWFKKKS